MTQEELAAGLKAGNEYVAYVIVPYPAPTVRWNAKAVDADSFVGETWLRDGGDKDYQVSSDFINRRYMDAMQTAAFMLAITDAWLQI